MKKFSILLIIIAIMSLFVVAYADEAEQEPTEAYIDSLSELEDLYSDYSQEEEEDPLKSSYDMYQSYLKEYYEQYERPITYKAKVIEVGKVEEKYYQQDYYSVSKYVVQKVKVEIIEGEYKGKQKEFDYILTMDSLNNITIAEATVGDIVFVTVEPAESGDIDVAVPNSWASTSKFHVVIVLAIIAIILLIIYAGKKGLSTSLVALMAILATVVVICTFVFNDMGVAWASVLMMIVLSLSICAIHIGFNKQMLKAFLISIGMVLVAWLVLFIACKGARIVGISFEFAAIAENIIHGDMHFEMLYYIISLFIATGIISNTVAMAVERMLKENVENFTDRIEVSKKILASNIIILSVVIFALYIPNHLLLLSNKFLVKEILNSETFVSELIRFLVIAITTTISIPFASLNVFGFGNRYIEAPDEIEEINSANNNDKEAEVEPEQEIEEPSEEGKEETSEAKEEPEEKKESKGKKGKSKGKK